MGIFSGIQDGDNYAAKAGYSVPVYVNAAMNRRAAFRPYEGTPISDITDGTSNTIAVSEYLKGTDATDARGGIYTNRAGCKFLFVRTTPNSLVGDSLCSYNSGFCQNGSGRNQPDLNLPCVPGDDAANFATPRSGHPGGVNAVFCDGSVHFIPNSIDSHVPTTTTDPPGVWQRLGWIADNYSISGDF
jgi:prepilin-type processing-associated H-X9-DG protein